MNTKKWTTKDGLKIRIKDMGNSHLLNAIEFLERIAATYENECPCDGDKDWCFCYSTRQVDPEDVSPLYFDLKKEALRRNLIQYDEHDKYDREDQ